MFHSTATTTTIRPSMTPSKTSVPAKAKTTNALSGFSGFSSPFGSYTDGPRAPFALPGPPISLCQLPNDVLASATTQGCARCFQRNAITYQSFELCVVSTVTSEVFANHCSGLTSEEDETVEVQVELKGAKLFIKRGRRQLTDGIFSVSHCTSTLFHVNRMSV